MNSNSYFCNAPDEFFPARVLVIRPTVDGESIAEDDFILSIEGATHVANIKAPRAGRLYLEVKPGQVVQSKQPIFSIMPRWSRKKPASRRNSIGYKLYDGAKEVLFWGAVCGVVAYVFSDQIGRAYSDFTKSEYVDFSRIADALSIDRLSEYLSATKKAGGDIEPEATVVSGIEHHSPGTIVYDPSEPAPMLAIPNGAKLVGDM